ncbi:MAG: anti-sigma regulatory factor [Actinobacteria bacterium]|nr:anti-sigma regulatory factor [Actinomycetota bacterium]
MEAEGQVSIRSEGDIVEVRRKVREEATCLGFGITDVTRIVTAASELARNIYLYAGSGVMTWRSLDSPERVGLELVFIDSGPGIADQEQAMQPGYSTSGGLGLGLPGAKRLMDEFEIESVPGSGTKVTGRKWLTRVAVRRI